MTNWSKYEARLKARRAALTQEILGIEETLENEPTKNWEDRATERQGDEVLEALGKHDMSELRQISAALDRIAAGTFGICVLCGQPVESERLKALPATPFCVLCAA